MKNDMPVKGVTRLFPTARWKAYLKELQDNPGADDNNGQPRVIYHIYHSQKIWFTREERNDYQNTAREHLQQSDALLEDCAARISALEATLANTPRPSQVLDWGRLW
jgi:hypothetical protein